MEALGEKERKKRQTYNHDNVNKKGNTITDDNPVGMRGCIDENGSRESS
jgi:hypothetical protein